MRKIFLLIEDLPVSDIIAVTAFDESRSMLCDGAARCCREHAIRDCLDKLAAVVELAAYELVIEDLNPNSDP